MFVDELSLQQEKSKATPVYETLFVTNKGKVGVITLNRPHALNALNALLISELNRTLDRLDGELLLPIRPVDRSYSRACVLVAVGRIAFWIEQEIAPQQIERLCRIRRNNPLWSG